MIIYGFLDILARGRAHQPLTPAERTLLRFVDGLLVAAVVDVTVALMPLMSGGTVAPVPTLLRVAAATLVQAAMMALVKFAKAQGDPALPSSPTPPGTHS